MLSCTDFLYFTFEMQQHLKQFTHSKAVAKKKKRFQKEK